MRAALAAHDYLLRSTRGLFPCPVKFEQTSGNTSVHTRVMLGGRQKIASQSKLRLVVHQSGFEGLQNLKKLIYGVLIGCKAIKICVAEY